MCPFLNCNSEGRDYCDLAARKLSPTKVSGTCESDLYTDCPTYTSGDRDADALATEVYKHNTIHYGESDDEYAIEDHYDDFDSEYDEEESEEE